MNILDKIIEARIEAVRNNRKTVSAENLRKSASKRTHHSLIDSIKSRRSISVIAEFKRASPSKGPIATNADPAVIAQKYEKAKAAGMSVLTEPNYFKGSDKDFLAARAASSLPLLRKDFMLDPYQITESAALGADVILLILSILSKNQAMELYACAEELGLEVLAETHAPMEVETAISMKNALIGVNSRNLKTLETDISILPKMATLVPSDRIAVAESGIKSRSDIDKLKTCGFSAFLIGEVLMSSANTSDLLSSFTA